MSSVTKQKYHSKYYGTIGWPGLWQALHCDNLWNLCLWKASKQCFLCGYSLGWVTMAGPPPVLRSVSSLHGISFCFPCSFFISFLLILEVHLPCPALPCPPPMVLPLVQSPAWVFWGLLSPHHRLTCCGWQRPRRLATGYLEVASVAASRFKTF